MMLLASMAGVFFTLFALYSAVLAVLLPNQIQNLDPVHKNSVLGVVFAVTSVFSSIATPVAGALSDQTRSRFGRRTPWIFIGALTGAALLSMVPLLKNLVSITAAWVGAATALNCMQPAITAVVADRVAPERRGFASGIVGSSMTAGLSAGLILAGAIAAHLALAYWLFSAAVATSAVVFVTLNPDPRKNLPPPAKFHPLEFMKGFWIDPRTHPDFAWAFLSRFTIYMGYQAIATYLFYILQDHIGLNQAAANKAISSISTITLFALVISGLASGWLSDQFRKRKPFVVAAGLIMAVAILMPLIFPSYRGMLMYAVLIGLGYGAFMSVDLALMTQVLPEADRSSEDTGKDLGILTTAVNVPQIISPVMAAWLLAMSGNKYAPLFIAGVAFVGLGALLVLPIRSVK